MYNTGIKAHYWSDYDVTFCHSAKLARCKSATHSQQQTSRLTRAIETIGMELQGAARANTGIHAAAPAKPTESSHWLAVHRGGAETTTPGLPP